MNQDKIGKFISQCRKEKNMTQQELADILNVTDRAVSNWERGRRIPDISLFKPLCESLGITINELINGEKISEEKVLLKQEETLINTLNDNEKIRKKSNNIIKLLFIILFGLLIFIVFIYRSIYPKIDIYSLDIQPSDPDKPYNLEKQFKYSINNKKYDIWYYGVDSVYFCDGKENCYSIKSSFEHNQTSIDNFKKYLDQQFVFGNTNRSILFDGGTTIYYNNGYTVMFCNTISGNKDIYIGSSDMVDKLNGEYCGHEKNPDKSYIRTYKVLSSSINIDDSEFNDVLLEQNNGSKGIALISNSYNLIPGRTYEFSFITFDKFDDTIENIFKYSTFLNAIETDKSDEEQINENIYVNLSLDDDTELNELEHVSMSIKEGTLTNTSATIVITDYSGGKYIYGDPFRIDKKENGTWSEVNGACDNCAFNMMAYGPDINGILTFDLDWNRMYGKLLPGRYRIVKDASINSDLPCDAECTKYYFSVEFDIE